MLSSREELLGRFGISLGDCSSVINAFAAVGLGSADGEADAVPDREDNCPGDISKSRTDPDNVWNHNPQQEDANGNGMGDAHR